MTTTPAMPELPEPDRTMWQHGTQIDHYTADQMRAYALATLQAQPAEVSDAEIERIFKECGGQWNGDQWVIEDADFHPAIREFLALRPQAVPMTDEQIDKLKQGPSQTYRDFARAVEAHHGITAPAGGEKQA